MPALALAHPNQVDMNSRMEKAVLNMRVEARPRNTAVGVDPKKEEYMQFCDCVYPCDNFCYKLENTKVCRFMFCQSFREKKKRGGRNHNSVFFDYDDYKKVVDNFFTGTAGDASWTFPVSANPCGPALFSACRAMLREMHKEQVADRQTAEHWEGIWQSNLEQIEKHVKERVPLQKKLTYQEKVCGEFAPCTVAERYDDIEEAMFQLSYGNNVRCLVW